MSETESMPCSCDDVVALGAAAARIAPGLPRAFTVTVAHRFAKKEREVSVCVAAQDHQKGAA